MTLEELLQRLRGAAADPPKAPTIRTQPGRVTRQTLISRQRVLAEAREQIAREARGKIVG